MKRLVLRLCLISLGCASAPSARADSNLALEVLDVAGGRAYINAGETAGLKSGDSVRFGAQSFRVLSVSKQSAVLELQGKRLKRGQRGSALVVRAERTEARAARAKPHALSAFQEQWPRATVPALSQHPKPVPLGPQSESGRTRALLGLAAGGSIPLSAPGSPWLRGELSARVRSEPFRALPLALDADAALQLWAASGPGYARSSASRPLLRVRALELAYGGERALYAAAGRLRYASQLSGMLDGLKAQAPLGAGISLAAFGGFVPDPLSGKPQTGAARFGGGLSWEDQQHALRPRVSLEAQGSHFDGALDERKLQANVDVFPGRSHAAAYAALSMFDQDNAYGASTKELSAAGASVQTRFGRVELDARFDMARPERSRWLASFLPPGWFCTRRTTSNAAEQDLCRTGDARYVTQLDAAWRGERLVLGAGALWSRTSHTDAEQLAGFANVSLLRVLNALHLDASTLAQTGSLLRSASVSVGAGSLFAQDSVDISIHYRPALTRYQADTGAFIEHTARASVLFLLGRNLHLSLDADAIAGRDLKVLLLQSMLQWRPDAV